MNRSTKILRRIQSLSLGDVIWVSQQGNKVILHRFHEPRAAFVIHPISCDVHIYLEDRVVVYERLGDETTAQLVSATLRCLPTTNTSGKPIIRGRDRHMLIRDFIHETIS